MSIEYRLASKQCILTLEQTWLHSDSHLLTQERLSSVRKIFQPPCSRSDGVKSFLPPHVTATVLKVKRSPGGSWPHLICDQRDPRGVIRKTFCSTVFLKDFFEKSVLPQL